MGKIVFITATNTDVGKTYLATKLIEKLQANRTLALGCKPIESGGEGEFSDSALLLLASQKRGEFKELSIPSINFYNFKLPAAPIVAKGDTEISIDHIVDSCNNLASICDTLIVEGAGGLYVPLCKDKNGNDIFILDLIKTVTKDVILLGESRLGCINNMILSYKALNSVGISPICAINVRDDNFYKISYDYLKSYFKKLYIIPDDIESLALAIA